MAHTGHRKARGQLVYSDLAIETVLALRLVLRLGLRQIEGTLGSIAHLLGIGIIRRRLHARTLPNQKTEARIGCEVLNRMTSLGMPISVRIK
jgi:hypothetical protein